MRQLVDDHDDLRSALSDPSRSVADKRELLDQPARRQGAAGDRCCWSGRPSAATHGAIDGALAEFQDLAAEANDERIATVRTARELDDAERERLVAALSQQYDTHGPPAGRGRPRA